MTLYLYRQGHYYLADFGIAKDEACPADEVLAGQKPVAGTVPIDLFVRHLHEPVPRLASSRPDLPSGLDRVIQRATAKNPADRYPDAAALLADLRRALSDADSRSSPAFTRPGWDTLAADWATPAGTPQ